MKQWNVIVCLAAALVLASCATTISRSVMRPAQFDLDGAASIAVLPFAASGTTNIDSSGLLLVDVIQLASSLAGDGEPDERRMVDYVTSQLTARLSQSGYYTLISASAVTRAVQAGNPPPVDVYLTGSVIDFSHHTSTRTEKRWLDADKKEYVIDTFYTRHVDVRIQYQAIDARTDRVLATNTRSYSASSGEHSSRTALPPPYRIIEPRLDTFVAQVMRELEPYPETVKVRLLKDRSGSEYLKAAGNLARQGELATARDMFLKEYRYSGNFVAGYNAALLWQADGQLEEARTLLSALVESSGDKRAIKALAALDYEIAQQEKLRRQEAAREQ